LVYFLLFLISPETGVIGDRDIHSIVLIMLEFVNMVTYLLNLAKSRYCLNRILSVWRSGYKSIFGELCAFREVAIICQTM
jgi:hypothetical protein